MTARRTSVTAARTRCISAVRPTNSAGDRGTRRFSAPREMSITSDDAAVACVRSWPLNIVYLCPGRREQPATVAPNSTARPQHDAVGHVLTHERGATPRTCQRLHDVLSTEEN